MLLHHFLTIDHGFFVGRWLVHTGQLGVEEHSDIVHGLLGVLSGSLDGLAYHCFLLVLLCQQVLCRGSLHLLGEAADLVIFVRGRPVFGPTIGGCCRCTLCWCRLWPLLAAHFYDVCIDPLGVLWAELRACSHVDVDGIVLFLRALHHSGNRPLIGSIRLNSRPSWFVLLRCFDRIDCHLRIEHVWLLVKSPFALDPTIVL